MRFHLYLPSPIRDFSRTIMIRANLPAKASLLSWIVDSWLKASVHFFVFCTQIANSGSLTVREYVAGSMKPPGFLSHSGGLALAGFAKWESRICCFILLDSFAVHIWKTFQFTGRRESVFLPSDQLAWGCLYEFSFQTAMFSVAERKKCHNSVGRFFGWSPHTDEFDIRIICSDTARNNSPYDGLWRKSISGLVTEKCSVVFWIWAWAETISKKLQRKE